MRLTDKSHDGDAVRKNLLFHGILPDSIRDQLIVAAKLSQIRGHLCLAVSTPAISARNSSPDER